MGRAIIAAPGPAGHDVNDSETLARRSAFLELLARRLHQYGTPSQRLEEAVAAVAEKLGIACQVLATPTGITLSLAPKEHAQDPLCYHTLVVRVNPGDVHLALLARVDAIAEAVSRGSLDLEAGFVALRGLAESRSWRLRVALVGAWGLSSASVAALLGMDLAGVLLAGGVGGLIGLFSLFAEGRPNLAIAFEALAALFASLAAHLAAALLAPIHVQTLVLASIIVLLPGLALTTAVAEVASQQLASGTARFSGAVATLLKLTFGAVAGAELAAGLGFQAPTLSAPPPASGPESWLALLGASFAFAILFRAARGDVPLVMASAWLGYLAAKLGGGVGGAEFAVFFGGLVVSAAANAYARIAGRPGALVRVPGIILLVPGSVGFRGFALVFEHELLLGIDTMFRMLMVLTTLVAGLLFGNLLVPPRRQLA